MRDMLRCFPIQLCSNTSKQVAKILLRLFSTIFNILFFPFEPSNNKYWCKNSFLFFLSFFSLQLTKLKQTYIHTQTSSNSFPLLNPHLYNIYTHTYIHTRNIHTYTYTYTPHTTHTHTYTRIHNYQYFTFFPFHLLILLHKCHKYLPARIYLSTQIYIYV